jgi:Fic family protein
MIKRECLNLFQEEFEDTKGIIRIRKSKNRRYNGQKKKYKRTNNDLQNIHIKLKIEKHEPIKTRGELRCPGRVSKSCSTSDSRRVDLATNPVISYE